MKIVIEVDLGLHSSLRNSKNFHQEAKPFIQSVLAHIPNNKLINLSDVLDNENNKVQRTESGQRYVVIGALREGEGAHAGDDDMIVSAQAILVDAPFIAATYRIEDGSQVERHVSEVIAAQ